MRTRARTLTAVAIAAGVGMVALGWTTAAEAKPRQWGGFGHLSVGLTLAEFGDLRSDLNAAGALGGGVDPIVVAGDFGGGGKTLFGKRFIVGGKGYTLVSPRLKGNDGEARLIGGGGGFDFGVALVNNRRWLGYPFVGIGGMGFALQIENESDGPIRFGASDPIAPGAKEGFASGFMTFEVGGGVQRLLFKGNGGFIVGAEFGVRWSAFASPWLDAQEREVLSFQRVGLTGGYIRLTIGGGGFSR